MFKKYNYGEVEFNVAYAIAAGILNRDEVSVEVLEALERHPGFFESLKVRGELRLPEE